MSLTDHKSMEGLSPEQQATKAIKHLLQRVKDDDSVYFLIGAGSQSFDLLTEAYATLTGNDLSVIRKELMSKSAA
jgi:glycerate-2-kinase